MELDRFDGIEAVYVLEFNKIINQLNFFFFFLHL